MTRKVQNVTIYRARGRLTNVLQRCSHEFLVFLRANLGLKSNYGRQSQALKNTMSRLGLPSLQE